VEVFLAFVVLPVLEERLGDHGEALDDLCVGGPDVDIEVGGSVSYHVACQVDLLAGGQVQVLLVDGVC